MLIANVFSITYAQKITFHGMYLQWGYNKEWYTHSNIHVTMSNGNNFILHNVSAKDKPDYEAIYQAPTDISIPQYNYRIGFYLNKENTRSVELNFDHAKYVVTNFQKAHITGNINGVQVNGDSILDPASFLHIEHTDGANWLHLNYASQHEIMKNLKKTRKMVTLIWKAGAGINIPRTDFTWKGERLNNDFHVAGYNISLEAGARYYFAKRWFLEGTGKSGYVRYVNALACTKTMSGNRLHHGFGYFELIALVGYDIRFKK